MLSATLCASSLGPRTGSLGPTHLDVLLGDHGADPRRGVRVGNDKDHVCKLLDGLDALLRVVDRLFVLELGGGGSEHVRERE